MRGGCGSCQLLRLQMYLLSIFPLPVTSFSPSLSRYQALMEARLELTPLVATALRPTAPIAPPMGEPVESSTANTLASVRVFQLT